jgi:hypothetical protein
MSSAAVPGTTRRGFLRLSGALASLAALGPTRALAAGAPPGAGAPRAAFFAPREAEILAAVVERVVATGEPGTPRARETGALATIEGLCAGLDPSLSRPLPWLLRLVEWGPLVFEGRLARFSRLPPEEQDAALRGWMRSRFGLRRLGFQALRNLAFLGWYAQPESWRLVGYAGPLLGARGEAGP